MVSIWGCRANSGDGTVNVDSVTSRGRYDFLTRQLKIDFMMRVEQNLLSKGTVSKAAVLLFMLRWA